MKKWISFCLLFLLTLGLAGCVNVGQKKADAEKMAVDTVSAEKPIAVDKEKKTVTVLATVNGKYFKSPTRHAVVYKGGKFGDKSVFQALGNQMDFYNALLDIGAKPGDNMTLENAAQTHVQGDVLDVKVIFDGKEIDINDAILDSKANKIEMHFGGNKVNAEEKNTGCIACLDSCPVGIVSNTTYKYGAVEKTKEVEFYGNEKVLPKDGTPVAIRFTLK